MPVSVVGKPSSEARMPSSEPCRPLPSIISAMPRNSAQHERTAAIIRRYPVSRLPAFATRPTVARQEVLVATRLDDSSRRAVAQARSSG
jgi:hypothetical protein